jgi:predicted alpha/beta superfamily hydrolase
MPNAATVMNGLLASEYFDLASRCVGDTFRIFVARPVFADPNGCPLLLAADGNAAFPLVTSIQRTLSMGGAVPAAFVVGVGYPTEGGFAQAIQKRNRDYPPTQGGDDVQAILGSNVEPGGPRFLAFLRDELMPALSARYSVDTDEPTFIGTSLGGLFGLWTLLTAPSTFRRYILGSPALFWNDEEIWQWESECARARDDIRASVFLGAGMLETAESTRQGALAMAESGPEHLRNRAKATIAWCDVHGWPRLAEILPELTAKLQSRRYASLDIQSQCLPDETHLSSPPVVISRGLRYVFQARGSRGCASEGSAGH